MTSTARCPPPPSSFDRPAGDLVLEPKGLVDITFDCEEEIHFDQDDQFDLPPLSKEASSSTSRRSGRYGYVALWVLFFLALSGLAFASVRFAQANQTKQGDGTQSSASSGSSSLDDVSVALGVDAVAYRANLVSVLLPLAPSSSVFVDSNSPQAQALEWLVFQDSWLKTDDIVATQGAGFHEIPWPLFQRYALMVLYFATNGGLWDLSTPWADNVNVPECDFEGVDCDEFGEVAYLDLAQRKLRGRLPEEVGTLLTSLYDLYLEENFLEGSIPSSYFNGLTRLEVLDLSLNELSFTLSNDIGKLSNLVGLSLDGQRVSGFLPESLKSLRALQFIRVAQTRMVGPIFEFLPYWPQLSHLDIAGSRLTGTIPASIGRTNPDLEIFDIEHGQINVTTVPTEIGLLTNLSILKIWSTEGEGATIPTEVGKLVQLEHLSIRGASIGGTIPSEIGRLTNLNDLVLDLGQLSGTVPSTIGLLWSLSSLGLSQNNLEGTLPSELGNLEHLETLQIQGNNIVGTIPLGVCESPDIWIFYDCSIAECGCCKSRCFD